jgi:hypothetical protein
MITASATSHLLVEVSEYQGIGFATVDLHGDGHYSLYEFYRRLPDVIECNGRLYGKSCWNSDQQKAYYRTDRHFAVAR